MSELLIFSLAVLLVAAVVAGSLIFAGTKAQKETAHEARRMAFAAATLVLMGAIFVEGMAMYYWAGENDNGKGIFDACKTVIPPIFTLILGYYFGSTREQNPVGS